jgi:hypothetical protein
MHHNKETYHVDLRFTGIVNYGRGTTQYQYIARQPSAPAWLRPDALNFSSAEDRMSYCLTTGFYAVRSLTRPYG